MVSAMLDTIFEFGQFLSRPIVTLWHTLLNLTQGALYAIDPQDRHVPSSSTIALSMLCFIELIVVGGVAIAYPTPSLRIIVITLSAMELLLILGFLVRDALYRREYFFY
jgi:hypothetical protein